MLRNLGATLLIIDGGGGTTIYLLAPRPVIYATSAKDYLQKTMMETGCNQTLRYLMHVCLVKPNRTMKTVRIANNPSQDSNFGTRTGK
jgi:hypothetical protein